MISRVLQAPKEQRQRSRAPLPIASCWGRRCAHGPRARRQRTGSLGVFVAGKGVAVHDVEEKVAEQLTDVPAVGALPPNTPAQRRRGLRQKCCRARGNAGGLVPHQNRAILASLLRRDCSTGSAESRTGLQNCCRRAPVSGSARTAAADRKIRPREGGQRQRECVCGTVAQARG